MPPAHTTTSTHEVTPPSPPPPELLQFTYLLISAGDFPLVKDSHVIISRSEGFSRLSLDWSSLPPLKIILREAVLVVARNNSASCVT